MLLYRVTLAKYANDLSGEGARRNKGRWNPAGVPIVYTSSSVALAAIECFVNTPPEIVSVTDFKRVDIYVPDEAPTEIVKVSDLPSNWSGMPAPDLLCEIGREWAERRESLLMCVPSAALCGHENNFLINPQHQLMRDVKVVDVKPFIYDPRLLSITKV